MDSLGRRLRAIRKSQDMTQEELAARMHISVRTVRTWERNGREARARAPELAIVFGISEIDLLNLEAHIPPPRNRSGGGG